MRVLCATIAVLLGAGCARAGAGSTPAPGWVAGIVLGGRPICPTPAVTGLHCRFAPRPRALVMIAGAAAHRRVRADGSGRFRVRVPPGRYTISVGTSRPIRVRVRSARVTRVHVGGVRER
jgi:hypothetical protein